jgi:hypothetical protein
MQPVGEGGGSVKLSAAPAVLIMHWSVATYTVHTRQHMIY